MSIKKFLKKLKPDSIDVLVNVELAENNLAEKIRKAKTNKFINYALLDDSVEIPYIVNKEVKELAYSITANSKNNKEKARDIYDWMDNHIQYDKNHKVKYRNSAEVLKDMMGICGSESFLYIVLARLNGLKAQSVEVSMDFQGRKVNHGCAVVKIGKKEIFVDPAYHSFDIHHKKYRILSDAEMLNLYKEWR
jgi:transglutaminase-like putative cysteine protease